MGRLFVTGISFIALGLASASASATVQTRTFKLTGTDWSILGDPPAAPPVSPLTIEFTLTADEAGVTVPTTDGLVIHSFGLPYPLLYSSNPYFLVIASHPYDSGGGCTDYANNFCAVVMNPFSASPSLAAMLQSPEQGAWFANRRTMEWRDGAVPEPASWAMMIGGFALAGLAMRRSRAIAVNYA